MSSSKRNSRARVNEDPTEDGGRTENDDADVDDNDDDEDDDDNLYTRPTGGRGGGGASYITGGYTSSKGTTTTGGGGGGAGLFRQILNSMNPAVCLSPLAAAGSCTNPLVHEDDEDYHRTMNYKAVVGPLIKNLKSSNKARTIALQKLFKLTDKESQQHRVPVVCSDDFNTIEALLPCLAPDDTVTIQDRRQALLLLNNLCIPLENKKHMLLGEDRDALLFSLLQIFQRRIPEAHIAAACLYNLSFLEEAKLMLLTYTPPSSLTAALMMNSRTRSAQSSYGVESPTENPNCLLRIVESLVADFTPALCRVMQQQQQVSTVEAATVRWGMALMRNLVTMHDNALIVAAKTKFPALAAQLLDGSTRDLAFWTRDSLEDSSLLLLMLLVQSGTESCQVMDENTPDLRPMCEKVGKYPGIHGVRAGVILQRLEEAANNTDGNTRTDQNDSSSNTNDDDDDDKNDDEVSKDGIVTKAKDEKRNDASALYHASEEKKEAERTVDDFEDGDTEIGENDDRNTMASF